MQFEVSFFMQCRVHGTLLLLLKHLAGGLYTGSVQPRAACWCLHVPAIPGHAILAVLAVAVCLKSVWAHPSQPVGLYRPNDLLGVGFRGQAGRGFRVQVRR